MITRPVRRKLTDGKTKTVYIMDYTDPATGKRKRIDLEATTAGKARDEANVRWNTIKAAANNPLHDTTIQVLLQLHNQRPNIMASTAKTETIQAKHLTTFAGETTTTDKINPQWLDEYAKKRRADGRRGKIRTANDSTIVKEIKLLLQACKWGFLRNLCPMPTWRVPRLSPIRKKARCLTQSEITALFNTMGEDTPLRYLMEFLFLTALRRSEAMRLTWANVDWHNHRLKFITTKGGRASDRIEDYVILSPRAIEILNKLNPACPGNPPRPNAPIFKNLRIKGSQRYAGTENLTNIIHRYARDAGLANHNQVGVHTMRHSCATMLLKNRATPAEAAKHLRHRDGGALLLKTYSHVFESDLRSAVGTLDSIGTGLALDNPTPNAKPNASKPRKRNA